MSKDNFFDDEQFQDALVTLLCRDAISLRQTAALLSPDDFKPLRGSNGGRARHEIAELALTHWDTYHEPIGRLLLSTALEYAESLALGDLRIQELKTYCAKVAAAVTSAPTAITDKVVRFKREKLKAAALSEMTDLQAAGGLTDEKWYEISKKALASNEYVSVTDYLATLPERLARRRHLENKIRRPWTFIDPLDSLILGLAPGELGMLLAPFKRGKSLMLHWLTVAYVLQHLNVLLFTLETPKSVVEDRLDSIITHVPIQVISEYPITVTRKFARFRTMVNRQLRIVDGTQGGVTIPVIEQICLQERDRGFLPDAIIVDYDDEIRATTPQKDRRFEFAEIYRDLRQLTARMGLITWTAAQTQRDTENLKIISGDRAAEDISKLRKVSLAISMGKGEWEDGESIYLWVAAANNDVQHVGCTVVPDRKRMLVFDREATARAARRNKRTT